MAKSIDSLVSFSSGEWSPKLDARVDQAKYRSAMRQSLNMIPYKSGGLTRRPGFPMIAPTKLASNSTHNFCARLQEFTFSPDTTFMLELGNGYIRFYSNGLQVSVTVADLPFWISINAYTAGTFVQSAGVSYYCILSISSKIPPFSNPPPASDPTHWVAQTILEQPTPYNADAGSAGPQPGSIYGTDVWNLAFEQVNDVVYIAHPDYPVYSLTRFSDTDWVMQQVAFNVPALLDQNATDTQITASATTGNGITLTVTAPAWATANYYSVGNSVEVVTASADLVVGLTYVITVVGSTPWTSVGAASNTAGVQFVATGTAVGSGTASAIYTCVVANVSSAVFANDLASGFWQQVLIFNQGHVGSTWQLAYLNQSSYLELDGTAAGGFSTGTDTGGGSWSSLPYTSSTIQVLGSWEVHTYGVWTADIAVQRSVDGGRTWDTIRTVSGRSDRNVDITGTAVQLGFYRFILSVPAGVSPTPINAGATNPRVVFEIVDAFLYGLVQITAVANNLSATANVVTELASTNPTEYWSEAAWSNYRGFPRAVASFQQRIIYASSGYEPQRIWATVTNDIENFALGDQTQATDSFAFDLNAPSRGPIQWLIAQTDLFAGFSGAEWVINSGSTSTSSGASGAAITPTNINAVEHSTWGSAEGVAPAIVGDAVVYTQRQATSLRQMMFSIYTAKYMSQDLTTLSDHLFASGIAQLCYMTRWRKQSIIWAVTQQGILCGMTYELDQEVFGWSRHQTGYGQVDSNGNPLGNDNGFESVSVLDGKGLNDDEVWVVTNRLIGGVQTRFIERMDPFNWEEAFTAAPNPPAPNLAQCFLVDCGITITSPGTLTLTGLSYLEGRYVVGLADGNAFGPLLVSSGSVTLPPSIPTTVGTVNIGLPISYAGQPMRLDADPRAGITQGLKKQISDLYLRVWNSMGGSVGNGTTKNPTWVSGNSYAVGALVVSPLTALTYQCVIAYSGSVDPSSSASWVQTTTPSYQPPVPLPYTRNPTNPFAAPQLITTPTDIRITPMLMPWPDNDPVVIVQGNDALPLTVLALIPKYDIASTP